MANFNFTFQPGMSSEQILGFEMAGRVWGQYIQDDAVFNIHVMATNELPSSVVGGSLPIFVTTDVATVKSTLAKDATSADDATAIANLNTTLDASGVAQYSAVLNDTQYQSSELSITRANAKALGWEDLETPDAVDGYVVFNNLSGSGFSWDYDFSRLSDSSSQQLDFLGMALHELGHVMGFTSSVDTADNVSTSANQSPLSPFDFFRFSDRTTPVPIQPDLSQTSLLDLFRYSEPSANLSAQELTPGESAYFSIDGGKTSLASLSTGLVEGDDGVKSYQASHWAPQTPTNDTRTSTSLLSQFPSVFDFISNPLTSTVSLATGILSIPGALLGQQIITPTADPSQRPVSLGIMDNAIIPGVRSNISNLDLQALDVIGYDINKTSSSLDYATLLTDTQALLAQELNIDINSLADALATSSLITDQQAALDDLLERRRSSAPTRRQTFFQDTDIEVKVSVDTSVDTTVSISAPAISAPATNAPKSPAVSSPVQSTESDLDTVDTVAQDELLGGEATRAAVRSDENNSKWEQASTDLFLSGNSQENLTTKSRWNSSIFIRDALFRDNLKDRLKGSQLLSSGAATNTAASTVNNSSNEFQGNDLADNSITDSPSILSSRPRSFLSGFRQWF